MHSLTGAPASLKKKKKRNRIITEQTFGRVFREQEWKWHRNKLLDGGHCFPWGCLTWKLELTKETFLHDRDLHVCLEDLWNKYLHGLCMYNQVTVKSTALVFQPRMNNTGSNDNADMLKLALPSDETTQWVSKQLCLISFTHTCLTTYTAVTPTVAHKNRCSQDCGAVTVIQSALSWLHSVGYRFVPSMLTSQRNS